MKHSRKGIFKSKLSYKTYVLSFVLVLNLLSLLCNLSSQIIRNRPKSTTILKLAMLQLLTPHKQLSFIYVDNCTSYLTFSGHSIQKPNFTDIIYEMDVITKEKVSQEGSRKCYQLLRNSFETRETIDKRARDKWTIMRNISLPDLFLKNAISVITACHHGNVEMSHSSKTGSQFYHTEEWTSKEHSCLAHGNIFYNIFHRF